MDERSGRRAPRRSFGGWPRRGCARDAGFEGRGMDAPWPGGGGRSLMRAKGAGAEGREVGDGDGPTERIDKRRGGKKRKGKEKKMKRR